MAHLNIDLFRIQQFNIHLSLKAHLFFMETRLHYQYPLLNQTTRQPDNSTTRQLNKWTTQKLPFISNKVKRKNMPVIRGMMYSARFLP